MCVNVTIDTAQEFKISTFGNLQEAYTLQHVNDYFSLQTSKYMTLCSVISAGG